MSELVRVTDMYEQTLTVIMEQFDFTTCTLRQMYHATDEVGLQISLPNYNSNIVPHRGLYIIAAILRRLGQSDEEITNILGSAFKQQPVRIGMYAGTSMLLRRNSKHPPLDFSFGEKDEHNFFISYEINDIHNDGRAFLEYHLSNGYGRKNFLCEPEEEIEYILRYVNK